MAVVNIPSYIILSEKCIVYTCLAAYMKNENIF